MIFNAKIYCLILLILNFMTKQAIKKVQELKNLTSKVLRMNYLAKKMQK